MTRRQPILECTQIVCVTITRNASRNENLFQCNRRENAFETLFLYLSLIEGAAERNSQRDTKIVSFKLEGKEGFLSRSCFWVHPSCESFTFALEDLTFRTHPDIYKQRRLTTFHLLFVKAVQKQSKNRVKDSVGLQKFSIVDS